MRRRRVAGRRVIAAVGIIVLASVGSWVAPRPAHASGANLLIAVELVSPSRPTTNDVVLVFDGALDPFSIPAGSDFVIDAGGVVQSPTNVSIPYALYGGALTLVRLDLGTAIDTGGTFNYTPGAHPLKTGGVAIDPIVGAQVDIEQTTSFDYVISIVDEGLGPDHALALYSQPLTTGPLPAAGDFVMTITPSGGTPVDHAATAIASVEPIYGVGLLDITLPVPLHVDDGATLAYTPGTTLLRNASGDPAPALTDGTVFVNVAATSTRATEPGTQVVVSPADQRSGTQPVALTFGTVSTGGSTTLATDTTGPAVPAGFQLGDPPDYFQISTTAVFSGGVQVCITYDETAYEPPESAIRLLHFDGAAWVDITTSIDVSLNVVCGTSPSLSPFVLATRTPFAFSGFFAPVDNPPTTNVLKSGATVPVKFGLGGDRGLNILSAGSPTSVGVACPSSGAFDPVETTTTSASGLRFDPASGQYVYSWKTDKVWAGTCRQLNIRLVDGSSHLATFQFR
jgi:hypothetical protein